MADQQRPGYKLIYRPYFTTKGGKRVYASAYGKRAWAFWVKA